MKIGISTACFYPMETEKAIQTLSSLNIKNIEIFFNADCELKGDILNKIRDIVKSDELSVLSVHPYTSAVETMSLFGNYPRRYFDILDDYKRYFEIMSRWQSEIFVLHGALKSAKVDQELYFERYSALYDIGREYGITVAQENVSYCKSGSLQFLLNMKKYLGESCGFVLDVKQSIRSGLSPFQILEELGGSIKHCHLSDHNDHNDCIPVGKGRLDFQRFADELKKINYRGNIILELYENGYKNIDELKDSIEYMEKFFETQDTKGA